MNEPNEYNVVGGIFGLGEYILLEILGEMIFVSDIQHFLGINKQTFGLKNHSRFYKLIKNALDPVKYTPLVPSYEDLTVVEESFIHSQMNDNCSTVLFDPVIDRRIYRLEILNVYEVVAVGISDQSVKYNQDDRPWIGGYDMIVRYDSCGWIYHISDCVLVNEQFDKGDRVALELNMESDPRTLTFFVNDIEQRQYITHIPTAVRFWSYIFRKGSQFKILRFDRLASPKAKHESGSHGWKWGSRWKCEEGGV